MNYLHALAALFVAFLKVGIFGFGGGLAMLPLIGQTMESFGILDRAEFGDLVAISQVTPGPIAVNAATYAGFKYAGILGAAVATIGVAVPSLILVLLVMHFLNKYQESKVVKGLQAGIRPAIIGLIAAAVLFIADGVLFEETHAMVVPCVMCLVSLGIMMMPKKINPIWVMILMGAIGAFVFV